MYGTMMLAPDPGLAQALLAQAVIANAQAQMMPQAVGALPALAAPVPAPTPQLAPVPHIPVVPQPTPTVPSTPLGFLGQFLHPRLGDMIAEPRGLTGELESFLPFSTGPQIAPLGLHEILSKILPQPIQSEPYGFAGELRWRSPPLGTPVPGAPLLPFSAAPAAQPAGSFLHDALARLHWPVALDYNPYRDPNFGKAPLLPFSAEPQLAPQGFLSKFLPPRLSDMISEPWGFIGGPPLGTPIGTIPHAGALLPFAAAPPSPQPPPHIAFPVLGSPGGFSRLIPPRWGDSLPDHWGLGQRPLTAHDLLPFATGPELAPMFIPPTAQQMLAMQQRLAAILPNPPRLPPLPISNCFGPPF